MKPALDSTGAGKAVVLIKLYLQKQQGGQIWPMDHSFPTHNLDESVVSGIKNSRGKHTVKLFIRFLYKVGFLHTTY